MVIFHLEMFGGSPEWQDSGAKYPVWVIFGEEVICTGGDWANCLGWGGV